MVNLPSQFSNGIFASEYSLAQHSLAAIVSAVAEEAKSSDRARLSAPFRILKVTQSYYPFFDAGGPAVKVRALAHGLAALGHSVTVLTSDLGIAGTAGPRGTFSKTDYGWRSDEGHIQTLYLPALGGYRALTWNPAVFRFCATRLPSFELVHIYGTYDLLGPVVARACRKRRIPYIIEPMGMFRPIVRNVALKRLYRKVFGGPLVQAAARVIATSVQERLELIEDGVAADKIVVRRNGVDLPVLPERGMFRREWNIPENAFVVLFLGRIVEKKSPDLLLEAFRRWRRVSGRKQDSFLVFAGPAEKPGFRRSLEEQARSGGLDAAVLFTGPLYGNAKWSSFVDADVFVLPSLHENFGNAAAEAVTCGTPAIVTDTCGIAPLIRGRAGVVVPHECEALVGALLQISGRLTRQQLRMGCVEVARGLGWKEPLAQTEALYAELLTKPMTIADQPEPGIGNIVDRQIREES